MITVNYKGQSYRLYWTYPVTTEEKVNKRKKSITYTSVRYTQAILEAISGDIISVYIRCNPEDNFSKETGRLLSLDKLSDLVHPVLSELLYKAYYTRK